MCGISGIFNLSGEAVSIKLLDLMNSQQLHRGPDGGDIWVDRNIGLGHRRLSIIDLISGKQPISNEDDSIYVTFNGEIYNHCELRENLQSKGHIFKTSCDTEVIVHLYEEYGASCVSYLDGMFAFAIFDIKKKYMLLARDRMGQKPLVYFNNPGNSEKGAVFAFSSELQALKKHPAMPTDMNNQAIHDFLSLQYIPAPQTIYKNVHKLPPGHILEISEKDPNVRISQYWQCQYDKKCDLNFNDATIQLRQLMEHSVQERLMSEVPLGAFLSGGIDSTIIVALMKKFSLMPVKTFTIGFNEEKYDERSFAQIAANHLKTEHFQKIVNTADFNTLELLIKHYGEPYSDASMLPTFMLSQFTREHVTVALSGDGADELFAGYYRYLVMKYARFADYIPFNFRKNIVTLLQKMIPLNTEERTFAGKADRILNTVSSSSNNRYLTIINRFNEDKKLSIYSNDFANLALENTQAQFDLISSQLTATNSIEKVMETDLLSYLPGDILTKVDIASMANSLEVRSPFMDHKVAKFAASLPIKYKQKGNNRKHILVEAFKDIIPKDLLERKKMGFGVPIAKWLREDWKDISKERILDGKSVSNCILNRTEVEKMLSQHHNMQTDNSYPIWSLLILEIWMEQNS